MNSILVVIGFIISFIWLCVSIIIYDKTEKRLINLATSLAFVSAFAVGIFSIYVGI